MLSEEGITEIRILSRQGKSIRGIAKELRISRSTVRKYLRGEAVEVVPRNGPGRPLLVKSVTDIFPEGIQLPNISNWLRGGHP